MRSRDFPSSFSRKFYFGDENCQNQIKYSKLFPIEVNSLDLMWHDNGKGCDLSEKKSALREIEKSFADKNWIDFEWTLSENISLKREVENRSLIKLAPRYWNENIEWSNELMAFILLSNQSFHFHVYQLSRFI